MNLEMFSAFTTTNQINHAIKIKSAVLLLIAFLFTSSCQGLSPADNHVEAEKEEPPIGMAQLFKERLQVGVDYPPRWQIATTIDIGTNFYITRSTPYGQGFNIWKEMIEMSFYGQKIKQHSVVLHYEEYLRNQKKICPDLEVQEILRSDTDIRFITTIAACKGLADQVVYGRFLQSPEGVHQLIYARKGERPPENIDSLWRKTIDTAHVIEVQRTTPAPPANSAQPG